MKDSLVALDEFTYTLAKTGSMLVDAKIFSSEELLALVEEEAVVQVSNAATLPGACGCSVAMPDMHMGYGFCVGGVSAYRVDGGVVSPGAIGFDINCGIRVLASNLVEEQVIPLIDELLSLLASRIPAGVGKKSSLTLSREEMKEVLLRGATWAVDNGFGVEDDVLRCEEQGCFSGAAPASLSQKAFSRGFSQLGTLGAGNHFLEVQVVEEIYDESLASAFGFSAPGQVVVMIHCGSRGVGHQICTDYLRRIEQEAPEIMASLSERNLAYMPLGSSLATEYLGAMRAAANFAFCNRQVIAHQTRKAFARLFPRSKLSAVYDVAHNIAKQETHVVDGKQVEVLVHRKGATRAFPAGHSAIGSVYRDTGHPVLIPGSMGTSSYVLVGTQKAMLESFGSSAHGAGRLMSRTQAKKEFVGSEVKSSLAKRNISVHAESVKGVAEEAPGVYKDIDEVIRVTVGAGLALPVVKLRPLGVVKG
ncbi:MAG: RtcB family protein [Candidatus Woesearchaeota archaeon]